MTVSDARPVSTSGKGKTVETRADGTQISREYGPHGTVRRDETVSPNGSKVVVTHQMGPNGRERAVETVHVDHMGRAVSKTVVVSHEHFGTTTIVYNHGRYGYVYHPVYVERARYYTSWYSPYWYTPAGVAIYHPFHYAWGWGGYPWYAYHRYYWAPYEVYPAPSYWVTDWMIAGYLADRYAVASQLTQAQGELQVAREELEQATAAARQAQGQAEIESAKAAAREAEARATIAEAKVRSVEADEAQAKTQLHANNSEANPIDPKVKEALKNQIEKVIAEGRKPDKTAKDQDLSVALSDPNYVYPVSASISVMLASDQSPAGNLTEGDMIRLEPGQERILASASESTFVSARVLSSKGEAGGVKAGTVVSLPLKSLQEFDSQFRAKLDLGMAEADKNQDQFKKGV